MSILAIQLPPRDRLLSRSAAHEAGAGLRLPAEWSYVLSTDGRSVAQQGRAAPSLFPRADHVVLVAGECDVSWHRLEVPRAPAARLRAALLGVMEESLLDDDEALHFALAPGAAGGQTAWVAVTHKPWLVAALTALETSGSNVERALPASQPGAPARGHFFVAESGGQAISWLALSDLERAVCLPLSGGLARALQPARIEDVRWTTTPAAAAAAESWLGAPVPLLSDAERLLEAAQGSANLLQFELAARHRGWRAIGAAAQRFLSREWRPVRAGLAALLVLNLIGLNAYAWHQQTVIANKRAKMTALLKATFPGVRAVLDAPLQMEREIERLRVAAGRPGDSDLEALIGAAATAWPDGVGPVQTLRFESGQLTLAAASWAEPQVTQFRARLRPLGFAAELADGRVTVTRNVPKPGSKGVA
jgi:general secretion pathway protein L